MHRMIKKVQKMIKQLNMNLDLYKMPEYMITETSIYNGDHTYIVHNLQAECEDGGVYFGDLEEKIITYQYALTGFLVDSVVDIVIQDENIEILFNTNSIKIKLAK